MFGFEKDKVLAVTINVTIHQAAIEANWILRGHCQQIAAKGDFVL